MKLRFFLLALAILLCASGAYAQTVFNVSGSFIDGPTLGGTITINTATGVVTAVNLTLSAPYAGAYTVIDSQGWNGTYFGIPVSTAANPTGLPQINLLLPPSTLVGYAGGTVCSNSVPCTHISSGFFPSVGVTFTLNSATLSPGSGSPPPSTPAPPTWILAAIAVALAAFTALLRRPKHA